MLAERNIVHPIPKLALQPIDPMPRASQHSTIRGLSQAEHILPIQPGALLRPAQPAVIADKYPTPGLVVHNTHIDRRRLRSIPDIRSDLPCRKSIVGRRKGVSPIIARQHTAAVRCQQNTISVSRIDKHIVDDQFGTGRSLPHPARVSRTVQTLRCPGKDDIQILRVLHQYSGPPCRGRNSLHLLKLLASVLALINSRTRAGINHIRILRVHDDGEHIRVFDDALFNAGPIRAAVSRLPRQMPGPRIDNLRISRIDRNGFDLVDLLAPFRADQLPVLPSVDRPVNTLQSPRHQYLRIRRRSLKRPNGLPTHIRIALPVHAAIVTDVESSIRVPQNPGSDQNTF